MARSNDPCRFCMGYGIWVTWKNRKQVRAGKILEIEAQKGDMHEPIRLSGDVAAAACPECGSKPPEQVAQRYR